MRAIVVDLGAARRALEAATLPTAELIRSITDPDVPISGSEWTVGEAAAHLAMGAEGYAEYARGVEPDYPVDPTDMPGSNRRKLAAMSERDGRKLGARLEQGIIVFLAATKGRAAQDLLPWHGGRSLPCATLTCLRLGEQLVHGYDIAGALGVPWPIDAEAARLVIQGVSPVLPGLVNGDAACNVRATYELAVRGGPRIAARFNDGTLTLGAADDGPVDCCLSGDPVAWLLALYGRSAWEDLMRTGAVAVTGGDAVLGAAFKHLLRNP
jgi:uncharacterized protein (TIGR03083 family)